ncbi:MAG TPA: universal stress protein [Terriglobales bacterium]|jgi:nucleotide-binding universal stress UspA family protein|nr:universal stress protein [Terriglobales bacterium]
MNFFETGSYVAFPRTSAGAPIPAPAREAQPHAVPPEAVVLALPARVPLAARVAQSLGLHGDIFVVRTSGVLGQKESALASRVRELEERHPELRMLELQRQGRTGKWLTNSATESLFLSNRWPVLVLRPQAYETSGPRVIRKILYATDLSAESVHALRYASAFTQECSTKLFVLQVETSEEGDQFQQQVALRGLCDWVQGQALDQGETTLGAAGCVVRFGNPAQKILETAAELQSEMIIIGARGRGAAPEGHFVGETAYEVACSSYSPVLIVPEPGEISPEPDLMVGTGLA